MSTLVVIGAQWGDEGKGKVVHFLGKGADYIVRCQGGNNAGHTVILPDNSISVQHIVPSGILIHGKKCLITNGVVIDPDVLYHEVKLLEKSNIYVKGRLFISDSAHVILPYHRYLDELHERAKVRIGTTRRGIGPCYADKVNRLGIRVVDYITPGIFRERCEILSGGESGSPPHNHLLPSDLSLLVIPEKATKEEILALLAKKSDEPGV